MPGFAIAAAAERANADLIVMGSRGLTGLKHALLGSVAERTVRTAPCPVLTVKHEGGAAARCARSWSRWTSRPPRTARSSSRRSLAKSAGPAHVILVHAYYVPIELEQYLIQHGKSVPDVLSPEAYQGSRGDPDEAAGRRHLVRVRGRRGRARDA